METIAVFNTKGGSGKSAAVVFLADFLSSRFQKRVLVVDLDPQKSSALALLGNDRLDTGLRLGQCLAKVLSETVDERRTTTDVKSILMERPQGEGHGRATYLGSVHVMACNRQRWEALEEQWSSLARRDGGCRHDILQTVLQPLADDFDICLIDFPAHATGPITRNGLRAAGWWIFPCIPDRSGSADIEGPVDAFRKACQRTKHRPKHLGTLLSICQRANTREFKKTEKSLRQLADEGYLPPLFDNKMQFWSDARDALDDTQWDSRTSLKKKYPKTPLYESARLLAKEVLTRLEMPADQVVTDSSLIQRLNSRVKKLFVGADVK